MNQTRCVSSDTHGTRPFPKVLDMNRLLTLFLACALALPVLFHAPDAHAEDVIDHAPFDALLEAHVNGRGMVDYKAIQAKRGELDAYVDAIASASVKGKSRKAKLAFYINAYNANVIKMVLDEWGGGVNKSRSVIKVDKFFDKPALKVAGKKTSLNELEKGLIIPKFKDARVHFVLVCAAISCPPLQNKALTEKNLNKVMNRATRKFIRKATTIDGETVTTSKLFEWYAGDFEKAEGSVEAYLKKYLEEEDAAKLDGATIEFSEYDWALNIK